MKRIRVLVVDDSPTYRLLLVEILRADVEIEVVGQAVDGLEAVEMVKRLRPDIVTMDVQMPRLDGFAATKRIMVEAPTPILITTSVDPRALSVSLEAVRVGALAVQAKPGDPMAPGFDEDARELVRQVKAMAQVKVVRHYDRAPASVEETSVSTVARALHDVPVELVAIAASTGGPAAIHRILTTLPADFFDSHPRRPAHLARLQPRVRGLAGQGLAAERQAREGGRGAAAGDRSTWPWTTITSASPPRARSISRAAPAVGGFRPSGTALFESAAKVFGPSAVAVILTGMGRDGVDGLRAIRRAGGRTIAESEATAVVYGMPGAAVRAGLADFILPLDEVCAAVGQLPTVGAPRKVATR